MDLVDMATQAIDGTKLQANAAKDRTYDAKGLQRLLERTSTVIKELEKQNEAGDDPPWLFYTNFLKASRQEASQPFFPFYTTKYGFNGM